MTNKLSNEDHPSYLIGLFNGCWSTKLSSEHYLNWVVDNCGILWPIIAITIVVFLVWSEYGSQDCRNQQCNNKAPVINKNDSPQQIIDKIMITSRKNHTLVSWRRAMLIAIIFGILILIWLYPSKMPHGFIFLIVAAIIFVITYFIFSWIQSQWWRQNDDKIEQSLQDLRHQLDSK